MKRLSVSVAAVITLICLPLLAATIAVSARVTALKPLDAPPIPLTARLMAASPDGKAYAWTLSRGVFVAVQNNAGVWESAPIQQGGNATSLAITRDAVYGFSVAWADGNGIHASIRLDAPEGSDPGYPYVWWRFDIDRVGVAVQLLTDPLRVVYLRDGVFTCKQYAAPAWQSGCSA